MVTMAGWFLLRFFPGLLNLTVEKLQEENGHCHPKIGSEINIS